MDNNQPNRENEKRLIDAIETLKKKFKDLQNENDRLRKMIYGDHDDYKLWDTQKIRDFLFFL